MPTKGAGIISLQGAIHLKAATLQFTPLALKLHKQAQQQQDNFIKQAIHNINVEFQRKNTAKAYDPKQQEYIYFCDYKYSHLHVGVR